jgi:hypothetical protein
LGLEDEKPKKIKAKPMKPKKGKDKYKLKTVYHLVPVGKDGKTGKPEKSLDSLDGLDLKSLGIDNIDALGLLAQIDTN